MMLIALVSCSTNAGRKLQSLATTQYNATDTTNIIPADVNISQPVIVIAGDFKYPYWVTNHWYVWQPEQSFDLKSWHGMPDSWCITWIGTNMVCFITNPPSPSYYRMKGTW